MDNSKTFGKFGWRKRKSNKSVSKTKENSSAAGCEIDFIADGEGREKDNNNKHSFKDKLAKRLSSSSQDKEKKKLGGKTSTASCHITAESTSEFFELLLSANGEYIQQNSGEMIHLKKSGCMTPKTIKDIQKLELLNRSLICYQDMLTIASKGFIEGSHTFADEHLSAMFGLIKLGIGGGVQGFSTLKIGDQCDAVVLYGNKKYRIKGTVNLEDNIIWNTRDITIQPIEFDCVIIKITESKAFGKFSSIGSVTVEVRNLLKAGTNKTEVILDKDGKMKLTLVHKWMPFEYNDIPSKYQDKSERDFDRGSSKNRGVGETIAAPTKVENLSKNQISDIQENSPLLMGNEILEMAFLDKMRENAIAVSTDKEPNKYQTGTNEVTETQGENKIVWAEAICLSMVSNHMLDDYRGKYPEIQLLETAVIDILSDLQRCVKTLDNYILDELKLDIQSSDKPADFLKDEKMNPKVIASKFSNIRFGDVQEMAYRAIVAHLKYSLEYLKDVGAYGPLEVREIIALHRLKYQGKILKLVMEVGQNQELELEDFPQLIKRRTLLEFWRSCCDGETELCVNSRILCMEFESEFGREVKRKHPDVANKIFPELVRRILGRSMSDEEDQTVTIFQLLQFCDEMGTDNKIEDLAKSVDKLGLEMFLTSALRSSNDDLILIAIKKVGTLLALRTSNLGALANLLLSREKAIRSAAAAHIIHIGKDALLRDKALVSYVELLESTLKRDRQSSCVALGFLGAKESIPQLSYLYHSDINIDVREAAAHALNALGDEGKLALEHASSTLLAQTMAQKVASRSSMRLGTAL